MNIGFEIDFMQVGDGERSGDAIALRYAHPLAGFGIAVIDGGSKESGQALVEHIRSAYDASTIDHVINTHPDNDHSSGLTVVLEQLTVKNLWMHRPWEYAPAIRSRFSDGRITDSSLEERIREALNAAHDVEQIALARRIPIYEPYQGNAIGPFLVLSPERAWYLNELVPNFDRTPEPKVEGFGFGALALGVLEKAKDAVTWLAERLDHETLAEDGETSAQNESSVILYGNFGGNGLLLTGDAGRNALTRAINYAQQLGVSLAGLNCVQVPHHGSRRNVSPSVLDCITAQYALISVSSNSSTHPRRQVTNAFRRRGARVFKTDGGLLNHTVGWQQRPGLIPATEIPFYDRVEA